MNRIYLEVPFSEKEQVKQMGAKWDAHHRMWYVPEGKDIEVFRRWLADESDISIRSNRYFIAQSVHQCWKCKKNTTVYGFVLPPGYETLEEEEEPPEWYSWEDPTIVSFVTCLLPSVVARIKQFSNEYYFDYSKTMKNKYWMNHCEHCGEKQGDSMIYYDPRGAFFPVDEESASKIIEPSQGNL